MYLNARPHTMIFQTACLQLYAGSLGKALFLFQHDNASERKAESIMKWFSQFGVEEFHWASQSPDLNLSQHLRHKLRARPYHNISGWPH